MTQDLKLIAELKGPGFQAYHYSTVPLFLLDQPKRALDPYGCMMSRELYSRVRDDLGMLHYSESWVQGTTGGLIDAFRA